MKFTTAVIATALLAGSAMAMPAAEPVAAAKKPDPNRQRAQRFNNWCIGAGQMCYKSKRDLDQAAVDVLSGYYAFDPEELEIIEKRDAKKPDPNRQRAQRFNNWCIGAGQMCYKSKRDLDSAVEHITAGFEAPSPDAIEKREADAKKPDPRRPRAQRFNNWCIGAGQMCYKSKRDLDDAVSLVIAGHEAPTPSE